MTGARISIGTAYGEAAAFVRREHRLLAPLVLALLVLPVTLAQLAQPPRPLDGSDASRTWFAIAATAFVIGLVGQMAMAKLAMAPDRSVGGAIGEALRRFPTVLGAFLMFGLCMTLAMIPLVILNLILNGPPGQTASPLQALPLIVAFAAAPKVLLVPALAMQERIGPWRLLKRSWNETRGQYWRLLGFFLLFLLASQILALAVTAVVGSLATLAIGAPRPWSVSQLLVALAIGLVQGVAATLYATMLGRIALQLPGSTRGI